MRKLVGLLGIAYAALKVAQRVNDYEVENGEFFRVKRTDFRPVVFVINNNSITVDYRDIYLSDIYVSLDGKKFPICSNEIDRIRNRIIEVLERKAPYVKLTSNILGLYRVKYN